MAAANTGPTPAEAVASLPPLTESQCERVAELLSLYAKPRPEPSEVPDRRRQYAIALRESLR